jgi:hypothetical protein
MRFLVVIYVAWRELGGSEFKAAASPVLSFEGSFDWGNKILHFVQDKP